MVRKIRAKLVLRLRAEGMTGRQIADTQRISRNSVAAVLAAADQAELAWADIADLDDAAVYQLVFPGRGEYSSAFAEPDWGKVHQELGRVGVTLKLLHAEYLAGCEQDGHLSMGYDRFCKGYAHHVDVAGAASRVLHKAGQTIEVDWSGKTMQLTDPAGITTRVWLFVACLPFSRYAFVEPTLDMRQDTWLRAHVSMYDWFGGSAPRLVCDNLKTGVVSHPREGEIVLNGAYRELAAHYSAAVLPGRVRRPRDKSSVENTVGNIATWVIGALRDREFRTLVELREAVREQVAAYNREPFQKRPGSRLEVFDSAERSLLRPLPAAQYELSEWANGRVVQKNGHVVWRKNFYSAPYTLVRQKVDLRITQHLLEIWRRGERVASHPLVPPHISNEYRTLDAHQPQGGPHQAWNGDRCRAWAARVGENATIVVNRIFEAVPVEEQGIDAALAVLRLSKRYSSERLDEACKLGLASRVYSPRYAHLEPILKTRQDQTGKRSPRFEVRDDSVGYVRGADYYASLDAAGSEQ